MTTKTETFATASLWYRARQFFQALVARPLGAAERQEIERILNPTQQALFYRMSEGDQRHAFQVMRTCVSVEQAGPTLLAAALLHDVGKSRHALRLWERPVVVLVRAFRPAVARRWGRGLAKGWRRPFAIYEQHPEWGAEMAAAAGCSPQVVWLIRRHQSSLAMIAHTDEELGARDLLLALQWADSVN